MRKHVCLEVNVVNDLIQYENMWEQQSKIVSESY